MENAIDALVIAGSIFLLMIALSVAIFSITSIKSQVDDVIIARDEVKYATDEAGNYINYIRNGNDIREVSFAEIISSIRRMRKENYIIYIYFGGTVPDGIPEAYKTRANEYTYIDGNKIIDSRRYYRDKFKE